VAVLMLPVLLLLVPLFDTLFVSVARTVAGCSIAQGGRDHTSHRLVSLGLSERGAVLTLYAMATGSGVVAALSYHYGLSYTVTLVGLLAVGLVVLGAKLGLERVYPHKNDTAVVRVLADVKYKKQIATISIDAALIVLAYYSAYLLRFEGALDNELPVFSKSLLPVLLAHVVVLGALGTYQDSWRHASIRDLLKITIATTTATAAAMLVVLLLFRFEGLSRAVFAIHWLLVTSLLCGSRVLFRALGELLIADSHQGPRTLIYGAGAGGAMVLREVRSNADLDWAIIGFIDDDRGKYQTNVNGVPVLGSLEQVATLLASGQVAQVVVSTSAVPHERLDALVRACADTGVRTVVASLQFRDLHTVVRGTRE
jgi:UDP-GlcNAc:undecaprenyl-phosphate GlcNAc-1-phosphate transferase